MAKQYLDKSGLSYFWSKIKAYVANAVKVTGVKGNSESTYRTGNVNLTAANVGAVDKSGDTMTGQLKTSYRQSVATGSYQAISTTIPNLCEELRYSSGCCGSFNLTGTAYTKDGYTIPLGWYNFMWIPHRSGGVNGVASGDNCNYGTLYITGMNTNWGRLWMLNYSGSTIQRLTEFFPLNGTVDPVNIKSGYLNIHPENSPVLIPFMHNDIAHLLKRGGSVVVTYDGTVQSVDISNVFDGSGSYWAINPTNITTIVIEIQLHKAFTYSNWVYVDFGNASWRSSGVTIEAMNSNYESDVWTSKYSTTTNTLGHVAVSMSHAPVGGSSGSGNGFNKLRFTFTGMTAGSATIFRIAQIGIYNYGSAGLRETFMSRGVDDPIFRSITPYATKTYDLGSTSKTWGGMFSHHIYAYEPANNTSQPEIVVQSQSYKFGLVMGSGGINHGMYDHKASKWVVLGDASNNWTFKGCADYANAIYPVTLRPTSANPTTLGGGQLRHFYASSSMTTAKPPTGDGPIIHLPWDGGNGFDAQIAVQNVSGRLAVRGMNAGTWQPWNQVYDEGHKPSLSADVTGTLPVANGGTGQTSAVNAANAFANALTTGSSDPTDADYYIAQYAGGGTTTTTYHRRPHSALWNYIKGKISSILGLTATTYSGTAANASKVSGHSVGVDVPSTAVFTDTVRNKIYTATCPTAAGTAAKVATLEEASGFSLAAGVRVAVCFQYGNTATTPTLNVNSSGAKTIAYPTSATAVSTGSGSTYNSWGAYETVLFTYNGTYWVKDTTGLLGYLAYNKAEDAKAVAQQAYSAIPAAGTAAILGTGTDTANRTWSAKILHDYIESGVPTTTWTAPTAISSAITVVSGGYYTSGRHCYVQMRCTLTNALSANAGIWAASGMPLPVTGTPPLTIIVNSRGGHACRVNTDGRLQIVADVDHGITAGTTIDIAGVYTIS